MSLFILKQVNIVIDQGNTSAKVGVFDRQKMLTSFIFKPLQIEKIRKILNEFSISRGILSAVTDVNSEIINLLSSRLTEFIMLDDNTLLPVQIKYNTPQTLGKDRVAAIVGAKQLQPGKNVLVIDAGTAITYDFLDASGCYWGGNISPGMTARFKALNQYTKRLPLLDENGDIPQLGYDTETAIRAGVVHGIVKEIDSYLDEYKLHHPDILFFLTGGHSFYFETRLKNSIFANENLVLNGLNEILNYQTKEHGKN